MTSGIGLLPGVVADAGIEAAVDSSLSSSFESGGQSQFHHARRMGHLQTGGMGGSHLSGGIQPGQGEARVNIGGNTGTALPVQIASTAATAHCHCQPCSDRSHRQHHNQLFNTRQGVATLLESGSHIAYIAIRTS